MTSHPRDTPQFYLTAPSPCPYLPGFQERKVFTHIVGRRAREINEVLTQGGFRRSQTIAYRPACEQCQACVSVRVLVDEFSPTGGMRRVLRRNDDLVGTEIPNRPSSEQYALFRRYLEARHGEGGMVDMTVLDYALMIEDSHVETHLVEYRRRGPDTAVHGRGQGPLVAVCLIDELSDGLSMVYSFFDPDFADRSIGTYLILDHVRRARERRLPHLYLGYWVRESKKMAYKERFVPQERLLASGWVRAT
ncbi:arginyltransferase [Enterovirga rhinocerotis]|uniref:Aspartate/glutamate leucyltransferase n=1 Tax=Enterovirga rhinocerotis TaxID=1339210 RepID=A0A4R7C946_9HYPH|nr:arginyltransferase [Enterovirga rhinocerotis]TDR93845.1 arginine-tRNA-protein transferase [Enterovirga rhinocerotis]